MSIEAKLNKVSLNEIIEYFGKKEFKIDINKYRFVLTDEEIYVLNKFIESYVEGKQFNYDSIAEELLYDVGLTKEKTDRTIVARLLVVAYKKIKHVDSYYVNEEQMKNKTLASSLYMDIKDESISLDEYNEFANNGVLFAATSRLERFIIKYRIGMVHDYKKLSLAGELDLDYYQDVASFCYQLGYSDKIISKYEIDNILLNLNKKLVSTKKLVNIQKLYNEVDLAIDSLNYYLKILNKYKKRNIEVPENSSLMREINDKRKFIGENLRLCALNSLLEEKERRLNH